MTTIQEENRMEAGHTETEIVLVWTNVPEESLGVTLAETLVREQLAACVHLLPQGRSFYTWQGSVHREPEWTLMIKTKRILYPALETRLLALHPYEVPEILMTPVTQSLPAYAQWLLDVTQGTPSA